MTVSVDPPVTLRDAPLPLANLLPLRAAVITLRFTAPSSLHFFHPPALIAFLRTLLGSPVDYDTQLTLDAPESGRTVYRAGDDYRFTLFCLASGEALMQTALERLMALPGSTPSDPSMPFRDNLVFRAAHDLFLGHAVKSVEGLSSYTLESLEQEAALWSQAQGVFLRWLSPVRLLRPKETRQGLKGEARYCHTRHEVSGELLFNRLHDALADLLRRRGQTPPPRGPAPAMNDQGHDLFWVDSRYRDAEGREQVMGGLMGVMGLAPQSPLTPEQWQCLVLGQYLGIGQRPAFGWGCYRLETDEGETTCVRADPAASLLTWIVEEANLASAYHAIRANLPSQRRLPMEGEEWEAFEEESVDEDMEDEEAPADRLARLGECLRTGEYAVPNLRGVIVREPDGDLRPLTILPFIDRVAQRAVAQALSPGLEQLMYHGSFGYRPRRSRESARTAIQAAYREGYRWVYESDIDDFFDTVDWERLKTRLIALYGDDPLVALILGWMAAPVEYQGELIVRRAGLPQGALLSPLLANLMLDDFDADLEHGGFRLVRFADGTPVQA
jgi:hypothetical protein